MPWAGLRFAKGSIGFAKYWNGNPLREKGGSGSAQDVVEMF